MAVLPKDQISARKWGEVARQLEEKHGVGNSHVQEFLDFGSISDLAAVIKRKSSVIAERIDENTIRLRLLTITYYESVENMVAGLPSNSNITSANFPKCGNGKTGTEEVELFLYRPVPKGESWSHKKVEKAIDKAGFISADLPELAVFKDHADELWEADIRYYITAIGASSRWRDPDGNVYVASLFLRPDDRRFNLNWLGDAWYDYDWFVVRRK